MGIGKRIDDMSALWDKKDKVESKPKEQNLVSFIPQEPKYRLEDLILSNSIKNQLLDVAEYIENTRTVFETWGFSETHKYSKRVGIN